MSHVLMCSVRLDFFFIASMVECFSFMDLLYESFALQKAVVGINVLFILLSMFM